MKGLLSLFTPKGDGSDLEKGKGFLKKPGDRFEAYVSKTGRNVIKASKDDGKHKYSAVQYSNGTVVETKTTKKK